jgi:hypothetical protein
MIEEEEKMIVNKKKKKSEDEGDHLDEEEDQEDEDDFNMDTDGVLKKAKDVRGYDQEDEEGDAEHEAVSGGANQRSSSQEQGDEDENNLHQFSNIFKDKYQKHISNIKGITAENNK